MPARELSTYIGVSLFCLPCGAMRGVDDVSAGRTHRRPIGARDEIAWADLDCGHGRWVHTVTLETRQVERERVGIPALEDLLVDDPAAVDMSQLDTQTLLAQESTE